ncbi:MULTISPECIES: CocE/NonD family hydrolase C-terminal non-catalytic domain-containing protein [unclassified Mesorhizobium]|nr:MULTISPECIES: CocE/NonD family hydrolase C-terminal non-catalytic domain-containing protein [unclassified Mesorhizobium]
MKPGETVAVELVLDACGYRFAPGHRLRHCPVPIGRPSCHRLATRLW